MYIDQHSAKSIFETFSHLKDYAHYGRLQFQKPSVFLCERRRNERLEFLIYQEKSLKITYGDTLSADFCGGCCM